MKEMREHPTENAPSGESTLTSGMHLRYAFRNQDLGCSQTLRSEGTGQNLQARCAETILCSLYFSWIHESHQQRVYLNEALSVANCLIVLGEMEKMRSTLDSLDHGSIAFALWIRDKFSRILTDIPMIYRLLRSASHMQLAEARQQKIVISQKEHTRRIAQDKALVS